MQTDPSGLTELSRWISECREINVAKVYEAGYQRNGTCAERSIGVRGRDLQRGIWLNTDLYMHWVKFYKVRGQKKNHWKVTADKTSPGVHKERGIVHAHTIQSGDTSQSMGHWIESLEGTHFSSGTHHKETHLKIKPLKGHKNPK